MDKNTVKFELSYGSGETQVSFSVHLHQITGVMVRPLPTSEPKGMVDPDAGKVSVMLITNVGAEIGLCQCKDLAAGEEIADKVREIVHIGYPESSITITL